MSLGITVLSSSASRAVAGAVESGRQSGWALLVTFHQNGVGPMRAMLLAGLLVLGFMRMASASVEVFDIEGMFANGRTLSGKFDFDNQIISPFQNQLAGSSFFISGNPEPIMDLYSQAYGTTSVYYDFTTSSKSTLLQFQFVVPHVGSNILDFSMAHFDFAQDFNYYSNFIDYRSDLVSATITPEAVPEPATLGLLALSVAGVLAVRRRDAQIGWNTRGAIALR